MHLYDSWYLRQFLEIFLFILKESGICDEDAAIRFMVLFEAAALFCKLTWVCPEMWYLMLTSICSYSLIGFNDRSRLSGGKWRNTHGSWDVVGIPILRQVIFFAVAVNVQVLLTWHCERSGALYDLAPPRQAMRPPQNVEHECKKRILFESYLLWLLQPVHQKCFTLIVYGLGYRALWPQGMSITVNCTSVSPPTISWIIWSMGYTCGRQAPGITWKTTAAACSRSSARVWVKTGWPQPLILEETPNSSSVMLDLKRCKTVLFQAGQLSLKHLQIIHLQTHGIDGQDAPSFLTLWSTKNLFWITPILPASFSVRLCLRMSAQCYIPLNSIDLLGLITHLTRNWKVKAWTTCKLRATGTLKNHVH